MVGSSHPWGWSSSRTLVPTSSTGTTSTWAGEDGERGSGRWCGSSTHGTEPKRALEALGRYAAEEVAEQLRRGREKARD